MLTAFRRSVGCRQKPARGPLQGAVREQERRPPGAARGDRTMQKLSVAHHKPSASWS